MYTMISVAEYASCTCHMVVCGAGSLDVVKVVVQQVQTPQPAVQGLHLTW